MKRKMKRFDDGGEVIDMRSSKDNTVGDDARARAMKFMESGKKDEVKEVAKPKASPAKASSAKSTTVKSKDTKAPVIKESTSSNEGEKLSDQYGYNTSGEEADDSLKRNYEAKNETDRLKKLEKAQALERVYPEEMIPGVGVMKGMARRATQKAAEQAKAKSIADKFVPIKEAIKNKKERVESSGAMPGDFKTGEIRKGYKSGGKVAGKLATRGYGKAR